MILTFLNNGIFFVVVFFLTLTQPNAYASNDVSNSSMKKPSEFTFYLSEFERKVAAKMALDIRYFCSEKLTNKTGKCLQPVTKLLVELANMITNTGIGSVVLFAENLASTKLFN